ncbi:hypothetical protein CERSUDRAFT_50154 [Gelatoporia subvermispora B]|uniref:Cytochrome P450 n=1 Tax=Ceriporiopsis subvermispora (strain B) TaxID=914234 RepID=M2QKH7_CERS8|nr:hypothetical protein CERSUDRAFT_50154 [Gelatoporia subvermispora B]
MTPNIILTTSLIGILLAFWWKRFKSQANTYWGSPLPPGPSPLPLIGNVFDMPNNYPWKVYAKWAKTYGDVVHLQVLGKHIIVLHSLDASRDLLDGRSSIYQDREVTEIVKLTGWDWNLAMMRYGQEWREHRRLIHQYMNQRAVHTYIPHVRDGTRHLLQRLHRDPKDYVYHVRYSIAEIALSMTYGIHAKDNDDHYVHLIASAIESVEQGLLPGSFWVDFMPALKHVPSWMPGAGWQKKVADWKGETDAVRKVPWENMLYPTHTQVNRQIPPIAAQMEERLSDLEDDACRRMHQTSQNTSAVIYAAAADTILSTLRTFILAMVLNPEAQKRAQRELDNVVGPGRLPDLSDFHSLPYTRALMKECMRWQQVVPLNFPRRCTSDNEYRGWLIPAGALVFQISWSILHDPETFPDPEDFRPECWLKDGVLNPDVLDPAAVIFGAGRRICPGRHFADIALSLSIARILHIFEITPILDADGTPKKPEVKMTSGLMSCVDSC